MKSLDVLGVGLATLDILTRVAQVPRSDEVLPIAELDVCGGGPVATALVQLARLGNRTEYLGAIGADLWGDLIERDFDREGVRHERSPKTVGAHSIVSVILVEQAGGARAILYHRAGAAELPVDAVDAELVGSARLLHLDGFHLDAALRAASIARERDVVVSFDGGAGVHLDGIEELLRKIDLLVVARAFAERATGVSEPADAARKLAEYGARQVVITDGARGSWYWDRQTSFHQPAFRVSAVDTTGAGDVFHGAYLHAFLAGRDPRECVRFASAAAALNCRHLGGRGGIAGQEEVRRFMEGRHDEHITD